ncbi:MAG: hypothetical protein NC236_00930 [Mycoplasma sp.]|nr:hypothetical protein [Mycoplasma sp.]
MLEKEAIDLFLENDECLAFNVVFNHVFKKVKPEAKKRYKKLTVAEIEIKYKTQLYIDLSMSVDFKINGNDKWCYLRTE